MTVALRHFWRFHCHLTESRQRLDDALARGGGDGHSQTLAWSALALTAYYQGDYVGARRYEEESLRLSRELRLADRIASGLSNLGMITQAEGDNRSARSLLEESLKKAREINDAVLIAQPIHNLSDLALEEGDFGRARELATEALLRWRSVGDLEGISLALVNLGLAAIELGALREAERLLRDALVAGKELGSPVAIGACLDGLAAIAVRDGKATSKRAAPGLRTLPAPPTLISTGAPVNVPLKIEPISLLRFAPQETGPSTFETTCWWSPIDLVA